MRTYFSRRLFSLAFSLALFGGCGGTSDPSPSVVSAQVNDKGPIFRSLDIALSDAGGVEVEYWTDRSPRLRVKSASHQTASHEIALPRLRANSRYSYEVHTTSDGQRSASLSSGTFDTADLPADIKAMTFAARGAASEPLTFLSVRSDFNGGVAIDDEGRVVWYGRTNTAPQGATRRGNGNWVLVVGDGLSEFSAFGDQVRHFPQSRMPSGAQIHHGVAATLQNTLLFLAVEPRVVGGVSLNGESIWEWNPQDDSLTKRWSAFDFLDPKVDFGPRSVATDWFHANSIAIGQHGNVILSFHFLDQVLSIAPDYASIEWRLGGPGSTYTVSADQATSGQHSAREIMPNRILLFDNGFMRSGGGKYSRGLELQLDPATREVSTVWQYRPTPDIWATVISSIRRLDNGNSLLTFGTQAGLIQATGPVAVQEVSPSGALLWDMVITLPPGGSVFQGDPMTTIAGEVVVQ
jgi:hypothetical protein